MATPRQKQAGTYEKYAPKWALVTAGAILVLSVALRNIGVDFAPVFAAWSAHYTAMAKGCDTVTIKPPTTTRLTQWQRSVDTRLLTLQSYDKGQDTRLTRLEAVSHLPGTKD